MARFIRRRGSGESQGGSESGWVPEWEDEGGAQDPYRGDGEEGRYDPQRVEGEIYDDDQGVEVVAEGDEEALPGGLTEQSARDAEARADARAAERGRAPSRENGDTHVAEDGAVIGR